MTGNICEMTDGRSTERNPLCPAVTSVVKKTLTTENTEIHGAKSSVSLCDLCGEKKLTTESTEIHGAKSSVSLCDLCGEKNTYHGEHGDPRS
jgi:hypothetical protein